MKHSKAYIIDMEDLIRKEIQNLDSSVQKCLNSCKNLELNGELQQKYTQLLQTACNSALSDMHKDLKNFE